MLRLLDLTQSEKGEPCVPGSDRAGGGGEEQKDDGGGAKRVKEAAPEGLWPLGVLGVWQ